MTTDKRYRGRNQITPEIKAHIEDWYRRKQEIGSVKTESHRLNVGVRALQAVIHRFRQKQR